MVYERFALLGTATGSLYALVALGVVVTYRTSGVLNFSAGAVGAMGAYVTYQLRDAHGVPTALAIALGLGSGLVLGVLTQLVVMRLLRRASTLAKVIATLGLMSAIQGVLVVWKGPTDLGQPDSILPTTIRHPFSPDLRIGEDRLILIGAAIGLALLLWLLYAHTPFGLATAAVAESRAVAAASGVDVDRVETVNFALGGVLSACAAIFLAPIFSLNVTTLTLIVVPALAAALVARFSSFGVTVGAALLISVVQAEIPNVPAIKSRLDYLSGLPTAVPLLLILAVTVATGRARLQRGETLTRLPLPGSGRVAPIPLLVAAGIGLLVVAASDAERADALIATFIAAILVLSVVVVTGYGGQLSLAQWALAGFGAWVAARLYDSQNLPFAVAAVIALVATMAAGLVVALPAMRTRGDSLAVATLALAIMIQAVILNNGRLTAGFAGTDVSDPKLFGWPISATSHPQRYAGVCLVLLVLCGLVVANLRRGRSGRRLLAVRANERAAAALGIGVRGAKLYAFGVAAALASVAGVLTAFRNDRVIYATFDVFGSITAVEYAVVGGLGWAGGAIIGALLSSGALLAKLLKDAFSTNDLDSYLLVAAGITVVVIVAARPDGLASFVQAIPERIRALSRWPAGIERAVTPEPPQMRAARTVEVRELTVRFGGVVALDRVSFMIEPGQVLGLIGPNGAGKTTLLDTVTGFTNPTAGDVLLDGISMRGWSPERRARAGLGRSFQAVELFDDLTVRDNLLVASDRQDWWRYLSDLLRPGRQPDSETMREVVAELELDDALDRRPTELSQGQARRLGIARAICAEPSVLFLDEPAAGLDAHESAELGELIRRIARERGIAVVLVEHDVPLVLSVCDRIVVLDFGRQIAQGTAAEIRRDPAVVAAYLGAETSEIESTPDARAETIHV